MKGALVGENMRLFEKQITLQILDTLWKEHLSVMDSLRQGIGLRGYGGKNPKQEYKRESFNLFQELLHNIQYEVIKFLSHVRIRQDEDVEAIDRQRAEEQAKERKVMQHRSMNAVDNPEGYMMENPPPKEAPLSPFVKKTPKVGRNEPCPCGSGKKYKQCHGRLS